MEWPGGPLLSGARRAGEVKEIKTSSPSSGCHQSREAAPNPFSQKDPGWGRGGRRGPGLGPGGGKPGTQGRDLKEALLAGWALTHMKGSILSHFASVSSWPHPTWT